MRGSTRTLKILRDRRFSCHNLLSSVFKEQLTGIFYHANKCFGYRQPTFISHLLIGLLPFIFLEDGSLLSGKDKPNFIGVKAHPFMHQYSIKALDPIAAMCEAAGIPMIIHLSSERDSYKYLPEHYPKLKLIYAHAGLPFWKKLWKYVKNQPNVFVDTSSDYLNSSLVKKAVESLGYRKVLYGCDGPYGMKAFNEYDYSAKKDWIASLQISDNEKEYILGKNFLELIG